MASQTKNLENYAIATYRDTYRQLTGDQRVAYGTAALSVATALFKAESEAVATDPAIGMDRLASAYSQMADLAARVAFDRECL